MCECTVHVCATLFTLGRYLSAGEWVELKRYRSFMNFRYTVRLLCNIHTFAYKTKQGTQNQAAVKKLSNMRIFDFLQKQFVMKNR